jgi:ABC-type nickel/cobalt efflux system permease component RcnA
VSAVTLAGAASRPTRLALRIAIFAAAAALAALALAGLSLLTGPAAAPPPRSPFGIGFREAQPAATGLGGWLLAMQASFSRSLQAAIGLIRDGGGWEPMLLLGFSYGVLHAAGPGHGKAVIAAYIVAGERVLARGIGLSLAAALLQAFVAITIVGVGTLALGATAAAMTRAGTLIETVSFALVAALGLAMTWRKAGRLVGLIGGTPTAACAPGCAHGHLDDVSRLERLRTWREHAAVIVAAGSRPCAGAVLLLVLALSQNVLAAGIVAVLAMALGTALTTALLATLAVFAKGLALRLAGGRGGAGALAVGGLEVLAGAVVLVLGLAMLSGLSAVSGG